VAGSTIDTIATLGAYVVPTSGHCRFREVDPVNHKGVCEIQFDNTRFAVSGAKSLLVSFSGAVNLAECDVTIPLLSVNPYDAVRGGMSNLDLAVSTRMGSYVQPPGFLTATFPTGTVASTTNITAGVMSTVNNVINAPTAGDFTPTMKASLNASTPASVQNVAAQSGDIFALIGPTGSGLTSLASASTALSTAQWTNARALLLDNLNVGGPVASHADILAVNQSVSKHVLIQTVGTYESPSSGTNSYTIEARTYASDGSAVNADTTPTLNAIGYKSGDLDANLSAATNPATGLYRWTYTVPVGATEEQVRFDIAATIAGLTFPLSCYTQVLFEATTAWGSTDAAHLTAIYNKLPANNIADDTLTIAAIGTPMQAYIQPTGFLNAIFPDGTVANTTNIMAGTISRVTLTDEVTTNNDKVGYALSAGGLDTVKGWGAWNARQTLQAVGQFLFGKRANTPPPNTGGTPTYHDNMGADYGSVTVDASGNIVTSMMTPPV
jgi:hypothetical protein